MGMGRLSAPDPFFTRWVPTFSGTRVRCNSWVRRSMVVELGLPARYGKAAARSQKSFDLLVISAFALIPSCGHSRLNDGQCAGREDAQIQVENFSAVQRVRCSSVLNSLLGDRCGNASRLLRRCNNPHMAQERASVPIQSVA